MSALQLGVLLIVTPFALALANGLLWGRRK